ncbi:O-antigen ligase [Mucilaginibacter sp.]|uniref:O-antigen ligase family protein n=1 Tax=Mucilaginibacter sp. TaxID=1882438 RepID=UPI002601E36A|nr:O-antigen ligase family protein [Mucilaginibacter sp.]MDB4926294.1 hypothetical protein [Mucilaginibacter sp.]
MISLLKKWPVKPIFATAILFFIGFQQFPIIRIGGSFKVYELLAIIILLTDIISIKKLKFANSASIAAFLFFVVSPLISYLYSNIFLGYPNGFFLRYEDANSFKFNYYVFPLLQVIYMFFNFSTFNVIAISSFIYLRFNIILKTIVVVGTCIAIYSLMAMFTVDIIALLPQYIQYKQPYDFRSSGLSQEPSFYVLYQSWICLITWYSKKIFKKRYWYILLIINVASLLLTFSTTLVSFFLILILNLLIFKSSTKRKSIVLSLLLILVLFGYYIIDHFGLYPQFEYAFVSKLMNFFTAPEHTLDSGSFRSYTSGIGIRIFKDHWLTGVGVGNSMYYMYLYEFKMGIVEFGQPLTAGTFPQNLFSIVLSEQGIIGGLSLLYFLFCSFKIIWINRNKSQYNKMFMSGILFNIAVMFSIAPAYSLFLWVFIALGLNYTKYFNSLNTKPKQVVS